MSLPPLVVDVETKRRACVLDMPLALSPHGLLFALRLAQEANVWLVRSLWRYLDNFEVGLDEHALGRTAASVINQWQAARVETDLAGLKVFWTADATRESQLPKDCDANLIARFDALDASLAAHTDNYCDTDEHFREVASLCVALVAYRPTILSLCDDSRAKKPALCRYLESVSIPCRRVRKPQRALMRRHWADQLARCGLAELLWAGLDVCAVQIVAPNAVVSSNVTGGEGYAQDRLLAPQHRNDDVWLGATAWWYPLAPG